MMQVSGGAAGGGWDAAAHRAPQEQLLHTGIVDADGVHHVQQVLRVHGEDVGGREHTPG